MSDFAPRCFKCEGNHFRDEPCVSNAPVYQKVYSIPTCTGCQRNEATIRELEAELEKYREQRRKKNLTQRRLMQKRREAKL